jgi:hypothetical protein
MRFIHLTILSAFVLVATLSAGSLAIAQSPPLEEARKHLPDTLGSFKAASPAVQFDEQSANKIGSFGATSAAIRSYRSKDVEIVSVFLIVTRSDSSAYALLTNWGCSGEAGEDIAKLRTELGTKSCVFPARIEFARGPVFVDVQFKKGDQVRPETLQTLAAVLAQPLDKGEDDVPVLVKHLPDWPNVQGPVSYAVNEETLKNWFSNQSVLDAVSFIGGAEAVMGHYDSGKLVIIEFNTAKIAGDNDWNIRTKINELRRPIQPVGAATPTAYRRVGNYGVFVFDAPSEPVANELIDQVKYQQVVQWLGDDPYAYERATREFTETTLGVFVSVVKASGLAVVMCLAVGGFFGALLFSRRRARQRNVEAYTDAGGMLRLNLDEMTPETDPARLLGRGVR